MVSRSTACSGMATGSAAGAGTEAKAVSKLEVAAVSASAAGAAGSSASATSAWVSGATSAKAAADSAVMRSVVRNMLCPSVRFRRSYRSRANAECAESTNGEGAAAGRANMAISRQRWPLSGAESVPIAASGGSGWRVEAQRKWGRHCCRPHSRRRVALVRRPMTWLPASCCNPGGICGIVAGARAGIRFRQAVVPALRSEFALPSPVRPAVPRPSSWPVLRRLPRGSCRSNPRESAYSGEASCGRSHHSSSPSGPGPPPPKQLRSVDHASRKVRPSDAVPLHSRRSAASSRIVSKVFNKSLVTSDR